MGAWALNSIKKNAKKKGGVEPGGGAQRAPPPGHTAPFSSTPNSHLNRHRHRSTATQAQRRQSSATAPAAQFVDQSGQDARAAGANGMAQRNRSTVNVYARPIPVEIFTIRQGLRRKGFADLEP